MKASKILIGLFLIVLAVFLVLDALGVTRPLDSIVGDVSFWQIVGGIALLSVALTSLFKGRIEEIFIPLALVFMIFERNIAFIAGAPEENLINNGVVLLCAVLLSIGLTMILPTRRRFFFIKKGKKPSQEGDVIIESGSPAFENKLKGSQKYIDCTDFSYQAVSNHLGSVEIYFENTANYKGGGILYVENHLGSVDIHVPADWCVRCEMDNSLGDIDTDGRSNQTGPTLTLRGENHLGSIDVCYD